MANGKRKGNGQEAAAGTEVWAYLRISTDGQEAGNGLDVQRQHIAAWAAANGVTVTRYVQDVESGSKEDRAGLAELRAATASGRVARVLVYRLDRLARDVVLSESLYRELSARASVVSVSESFGEGFTGNLMRQIIAAFAEYERAVIAGRLKGGRRESARAKGTFSGGPGVMGYRPTGTRQNRGYGALQVVDSEAEAVRLAFDLRGQGLTLQKVADELNAKGFRTVKGSTFGPVQVMRVLDREEFYRGAGVLARSYDAATGAHSPILA
jgi:DNA invertase Pin-like site-specific DNA recombinase